jgi:hypothetical protein
MIITTSTANIRRWLVTCPTCGYRVDAFTPAAADAMDEAHMAVHPVAA